MNPPPQPVAGSCTACAAGSTLDHLRGAAYPYCHAVLPPHGVPPVYGAPPAYGADAAAALASQAKTNRMMIMAVGVIALTVVAQAALRTFAFRFLPG